MAALHFVRNLDEKEFEEVVVKAVESIPKEFRDKLENVAIISQNLPSSYQMQKLRMRRGMLLGLYEGVPHTRRGNYGVGGPLPDKITIFQRPVETIARLSGRQVKDVVVDTVKHEIAHHFGMNEEQVRKAEGRRHR